MPLGAEACLQITWFPAALGDDNLLGAAPLGRDNLSDVVMNTSRRRDGKGSAKTAELMRQLWVERAELLQQLALLEAGMHLAA